MTAQHVEADLQRKNCRAELQKIKDGLFGLTFIGDFFFHQLPLTPSAATHFFLGAVCTSLMVKFSEMFLYLVTSLLLF